ncbi:hypothetical protein [Yoonia sediminilitoris]|uniref:Uncharacterized protein n=1 Tax=Yoonia sediminilitoris TaxID=1286148 RepID=A0A2T6KFR4_9RHOB|nr:hypothetical protein [Yoonia sediminilitoris]PUB14166.1 hypothetical protein C8N45_10639 [Yoonia sediminilitoris]RCW95097.1 hypothetical protein DFP92_10639 [Yoonia sediminilitoris]
MTIIRQQAKDDHRAVKATIGKNVIRKLHHGVQVYVNQMGEGKMKLITISAVTAVALCTAAFADGHTQKDKAQNMRDALQSGDNASVPAKNFTGGWGNIAGPANDKGKKNVAEKD